MNINAAIIDQQLNGICERIAERCCEELRIKNNPDKLKSISLVFLCVKKMLNLEDDEVFDCLTEGGGDIGVDAIHISDETDLEFVVTIFQAKYKKDLVGNSHFPENSIVRIINSVRCIFDPNVDISAVNERLKLRIEEIRSLIKDGFIAKIRIITCNNGLKWNESTQSLINREELGSQVTWEHINHDSLVNMMQNQTPVDTILRTSGKSIVEDLNYYRVCVGRISIFEIVELIKTFGDRLLERNIRKHLGNNRVNEEIKSTILGEHPEDFYFLNNGITLVCDKLDYNELQKSDNVIQVKNLQIINGGQTCTTIFKTLSDPHKLSLVTDNEASKNAMLLFRLYQLPSNSDDMVAKITYATNSQNLVDLRDLKSNDVIQQRLERNIADLGYVYRRKKSDLPYKQTDIASGTVAEAVLAVWLRKPHQAKFFTREYFGKLYDTIFSDKLNGSQVILAVLLYRIAENHRRRPCSDELLFTRYASCFIAMQMGRALLREANISNYTDVNHRNFSALHKLVEQRGEEYFAIAAHEIGAALSGLYGTKSDSISLQQLSATFRRGDLIDFLD